MAFAYLIEANIAEIIQRRSLNPPLWEECMRKLITLIVLGSVALVSADQYNQFFANRADSFPSWNYNGSYCQSYNENYHYKKNQRQNAQNYYRDQPNIYDYYLRNQRQDAQNYYLINN